MKKIIVGWGLLATGMMLETGMAAQAQKQENSFEEALHMLDVKEQLQSYYGELEQLLSSLSNPSPRDLPIAERTLTRVGIKWDIYCQSVEFEISTSDSLLQLVTDFQLLKQGVTDSIAHKKDYYAAIENFDLALQKVDQQKPTYQEMLEKAFELSLTKSTAEELEKLKQKEKLIFAEVLKQYQVAQTAVETCPKLAPKMRKMEDQFIELKNQSDKIQTAAYQPLMQRIKDYLYGLAAVAMILMFLNMVQSKIKAFNAKRKQLKKMGDWFNNDQDYPTI